MAKTLCTQYIDPSTIVPLVLSRLIPLDKGENAVRPIGVGEVIRRICGKCVMNIAKPDVFEASGLLQLCLEQKSGTEAAIRAMHRVFEADNTDASNTFNAFNRAAALRNIRVLFPVIEVHAINIYRHSARKAEELSEISDNLKQMASGKTKRAVELAQGKGSSVWLTVLPLQEHGLNLSKRESADFEFISDIHECVQNPNCSENANCTNIEGSYNCSCNPEFSGDGHECEDIDECSQSSHNCSNITATCNNTKGSFKCICKPGFSGDGNSCTDIDECEKNTHNCSHGNSTCQNNKGSFECICKPGFRGDGQNCS
ncbi:Fibrillin-1, partial [Stylophora pistillata]